MKKTRIITDDERRELDIDAVEDKLDSFLRKPGDTTSSPHDLVTDLSASELLDYLHRAELLRIPNRPSPAGDGLAGPEQALEFVKARLNRLPLARIVNTNRWDAIQLEQALDAVDQVAVDMFLPALCGAVYKSTDHRPDPPPCIKTLGHENGPDTDWKRHLHSNGSWKWPVSNGGNHD